MISTTWRHVRPGATVVINGTHWTIDARTASTITMHRTEQADEGTMTGTPNMDTSVAVLEPWVDQEPVTENQASATVKTFLGGIEI
jgi:hypothetical protein